MAIDLDWLASRFDSVSEKYPGLALIGLKSPRKFTLHNCEVPDPESGMHFPIRTDEGEYGHQFYFANDFAERNSQGITLMPCAPILAFPQWNFGCVGSEVLKRGWWAIWLHRKFGYDPEVTAEKQNLRSNSECLAAYLPILALATDVLIHQFYDAEEWFCEGGHVYDRRWQCCSPWLLFLLSTIRSRWDVRNRHVIDDIGLASSVMLRALRDSKGDEDGLFDQDRRLIWGGVQFMLTTNQAMVFRLLVDAYPRDVLKSTIEEKLGDGELRDSFRRKDSQGKNRPDPCWGLIVPGSRKDSKRLIAPEEVASNPKKFSDPQDNPQYSPG